MNTALFAVAVTAAAIALTWFCCMRPMLRRRDAADGACCTPAQRIDDQIRAARDELSQFQRARRDAWTGAASPDRHEA
ncbi:hypothetical protein ASG92_21505 [Arthrobacter sp. Soil736]|uniref:hypothetical protein n=1 Tax=Arthrobacter sp. Soil736 TaxID=1736395 RepID=UPI0006F8D738|nr:hypothetical protein [Arthrobacter sp. Soil736]KRE60532.1 hypothetical protein ASG92_21505 [Arthrobacter sp. Soil736]